MMHRRRSQRGLRRTITSWAIRRTRSSLWPAPDRIRARSCESKWYQPSPPIRSQAGPILNPLLLDPVAIAPITTTVARSRRSCPGRYPRRDLTLNEAFDSHGRLIQLLGTTTPAAVGKGFGLAYEAPTTEFVKAGSTEVWRIFNNTADTHPIHFHLVNVQVLSRQPFKLASGVARFTPTGVASVHNRTNSVGRKPCKCIRARSPRCL